MKFLKLVSLLLAAMLTLAILPGCSSEDSKETVNYDKREIAFLPEDFSWEFNSYDAYSYIEKNQSVTEEISIETYTDYTMVSDSTYIFRFGAEGEMEFVKYKMPRDPNVLDRMISWYGDYDTTFDVVEDIQKAYVWYGKMSGRNTEMCLTIDETNDDTVMLEFYPK